MKSIYNLNKDELVLLISEIERRTRREYEEKLAFLELEIKKKNLAISLIDPEGDNRIDFCDVRGCECYFLWDYSRGEFKANCPNSNECDYCFRKKCECHGIYDICDCQKERNI